VAESLKVPADKLKAAIRALLNTPPLPETAIEGKRRYVSDEGKKPGLRPRKR
jgi:hypothetical protein